MVKPAASPRIPICHSSKQVVPIQPEPSRIPIARPKTATLMARVKRPNMRKSPTTPSMMVKATMFHHKASGLLTRYSIKGLISKAFGRKWLNFSPI